MTKVRVCMIAAGLAVALVASPARANGPTSVLNNPAYPDVVAATQGASDVPLVWITATPIPGAGIVRYAHAQCLGQNSFYVIAGVAGGTVVTAVQRYDATANTWTARANIPIGGEGPAGVCFNGKIYVAGGAPAGTPTNNFQIYDIATTTWSAGAPLPRIVWGASMGARAGKVYVAGGDNDFNGGPVSNEVNIYDIATNTWLANGAAMINGTNSAGFAQIGTFLYVVGGWGSLAPGANSNVTQRYDMATNTWLAGPVFTSARADLPLAATSTAIYAIGGDNNGGGFFDSATTVERLPVSAFPAGSWAAVDSLPVPLTAHKGGFCTRSFFPATGEIWSTGGFPPFSRTNQYLQAEACESAVSVAPAALEVDPAPAGNRVLEPNEASVIVAPAWRNTGTSAIATMAGAATAFIGPAGATYTINDATAAYGAIAAGATASCTATGNCYAVTVTAATRPVVHWDSTITETVTPPGTVKNWTLHIGSSFTDVLTSSGFYRFVETILHKNVTGGCTATTYCPSASTTRDQMAVFVLVAKEPAGFNPPACVAGSERFTDVPASSGFCKWVEELARRGVVGGCTPTTYCPTAPATREQMSVFVLRTLDPALNPPACGTPVFADVPASSPFCKWIEELVRRGVVAGCGGGNYCPTAAVTREQMSVFLSVTFSLALYGV